MNINKGALITVAVASVLFSGCASFYKMVDPSSMETQTNMRWQSDLPDMDPIDSMCRIVYLSYKDASGSDLPNLRKDIEQSLSECGYVVTKNVTESWFTFEVRVLEFGTQKIESGVSTVVGAVAGGVTGAATGAAVGGTKSAVVGGVGMGGLGGIAGNIVDKHNPIQAYEFKIDVNVRERIPEGFTEKVLDSMTSRRVVGVDTDVTTVVRNSTDLVKKRNFINHKNTLVISVQKRGLTENEAYDAVVGRLSKAFGGILPDVDPDVDPVTPAEYLESLKNKEDKATGADADEE